MYLVGTRTNHQHRRSWFVGCKKACDHQLGAGSHGQGQIINTAEVGSCKGLRHPTWVRQREASTYELTFCPSSSTSLQPSSDNRRTWSPHNTRDPRNNELRDPFRRAGLSSPLDVSRRGTAPPRHTSKAQPPNPPRIECSSGMFLRNVPKLRLQTPQESSAPGQFE